MRQKSRNWKQHLDITKDYPPSPLLVQAISFVEKKEKAIDLGAGGLKDSRYLLEQGFDVSAVDSEEHVKELSKSIGSPKFHLFIQSLQEFLFPENTFDLVTSMFSLPFVHPQSFEVVFTKIKKSLKHGGIFCGQLFGVRDSFTTDSAMTFHTKVEVEKLLSDLTILVLEEQEKDAKTTNGALKHWHIFHFIAKKE